MKIDIDHLREDYRLASLGTSDAHENPLVQFGKWLKEAMDAQLPEPNAMTLATCAPDGKPAARIVLLKDYDQDGFVFFTNYNSRKGKDLMHNPHAALVFSWLELQRQVRIEGKVQKISAEQSTEYFQSRPKESQIGAWASPQSDTIVDRSVIEENFARLQQKYVNEEVLPRPENWGGYIVKPTLIEFWQGRTSRLHDRIEYRLLTNKEWIKERLAP